MPSVGTLRVYDPLLTNFSTAYRNQRSGYVARAILPAFPTGGAETGSYYEMERANLFTAPRMARRADGAESHEVRWGFTRRTFSCEARAYNTFNTPRQKKNVIGGINLDREDAEFLEELILLEREIDTYNLINGLTVVATPDLVTDNTKILGTTLATTAQWNDSTAPAANARGDVHTGKAAIRRMIGRPPNLMVMGAAIWDDIMSGSQTTGHAAKEIHDALRYVMATTNNNITPALVAQYFGMERLIVADAVQNSDGLDADLSVNNADIWGDSILLAYVAPRPVMKTPTFGWSFEAQRSRSFTWTKAERSNAKFVENEEITDERVVASIAGYIIKDVLE